MSETDKSVSDYSFIQFAEEIASSGRTYDDWKTVQYLASHQSETIQISEFKDWLFEKECNDIQLALTRMPMDLLSDYMGALLNISPKLPYTIPEILDMAKAKELPPEVCIAFYKVMHSSKETGKK